MLFEKKVLIYKKKDSETWKKIKAVLNEEGFKGVSASHYFGDVAAPGGCAAKLDPRSIGAGKDIDRDIYIIRVKESDKDAALEAIRAHGLVAVVDQDAAKDAALKYAEKEAAGREDLNN